VNVRLADNFDRFTLLERRNHNQLTEITQVFAGALALRAAIPLSISSAVSG
jgi:hypothetical protein